MSFTNRTPNYGLPQYIGTDKPSFLGDFNNAMDTIDTAMHENAENAGNAQTDLQESNELLQQAQEQFNNLEEQVESIEALADNVNKDVQKAVEAANNATTVASKAVDDVREAIEGAGDGGEESANQALQVAQQNASEIDSLESRVAALEEAAGGSIETLTGHISAEIPYNTVANPIPNLLTWRFNAPSGKRVAAFSFNFESFRALSATGCTVTVTPENGEATTWTYGNYPETETDVNIPVGDNPSYVDFAITVPLSGTIEIIGDYVLSYLGA